MGLFAFRRRQQREAASTEAASFAIEPSPKLEEEKPTPKKRRPVKSKQESTDGDHD